MDNNPEIEWRYAVRTGGFLCPVCGILVRKCSGEIRNVVTSNRGTIHCAGCFAYVGRIKHLEGNKHGC